MWARRSHTLAPLNNITSSKVKFKWTKIEHDAFDEIKRIVEDKIILYYSDFNEEFKIHTDATDFKLGAVIIQKSKPIIFYGKNLTISHKSNILTEK